MAFLAPIGYALGIGTAATATTAATGVLAASLVGGAVVGAAGMGIAGAIGGAQGSPSMPQGAQSPMAPTIEESRRQSEATALGKRRKRTKTVLTDLGDQNLLSPSVTGKSLLGGD